jgi:phytoene synthase
MRLAAFARVAARNSAAAAAFLPASLCELYLKEMERRGYQPFETVIRAPQWRRQWRLWRAAKAIR